MGQLPGAAVEFRLLGPLEIRVAGRLLPLTAPRLRHLLALLLLHANHTVPVAELARGIWEDRLPADPANQVAVCVSLLRRRLGQAGVDPRRVLTVPPGYVLTARDAELDTALVRRLRASADACAADGRLEEAAALLHRALSLWRGPLLSGMDRRAWRPEARAWEEERVALRERWAEVHLALGRYERVTSELAAFVQEHPFSERPRAQLMTALYRSGRRADALRLYRDTVRLFEDRLGAAPGPELRRLQREILRGAPPPAPSVPGGPEPGGTEPSHPEPEPGDPEPEPSGAEPGGAAAARARTPAPSAPRTPAPRTSASRADARPGRTDGEAPRGTGDRARTAPAAPDGVPRPRPAPCAPSPARPAPRRFAPAAPPEPRPALRPPSWAPRLPSLARRTPPPAPRSRTPGPQPPPTRPVGPPCPAPGPAGADRRRAAGAQTPAGPCLLPGDLRAFVGRERETAALAEALTPAAGGHVPVAAVAGGAGTGKTALAVHVAHLRRPAFPNGQLYVDLRGTHPRPVPPEEALGRFLRRLGTPGSALPSGLEQRAEAYRALLADKRVLVVLDDAASAAQIRPLLPGTGSCAVLVTSRARVASSLASLVVEPGLLTPEQALELLRRSAGEARPAAEPEAARRVVEFCGRLPLALGVVGARLAARPHWTLGRVAARLADARRRLDELEHDGVAVRARIALSYDAVGADARRMLRRLALLPVPEVADRVVAGLFGAGREAAEAAEAAVEQLVDARLVVAVGPDGAGGPRYRLHDLVRLFAAERAVEADAVVPATGPAHPTAAFPDEDLPHHPVVP
ncbi:BTAD domain-containing putative transcriptional regulator [Streptomyces sp. TRM76323]|uniref:BTAD domain-containing putative transcriptional regulator n=1 Tax=Streptomyces tamarix TaxID=3078565 RepID=A0ABU3QQA0_9ACTN|nr:BTAD domain-containing putative transcriptional regulator [Streptomyces tamarix]MDT9684921.1 BTAD domain-containing putative transcriptional regulator [Streptomyces tamarix]